MNYNRIAINIQKKLSKYGQSVTLRQFSVGGSDYDPATQVASLPASVETIRKALPADQPATRMGPQYGMNLKANTLITDTEKWLYLDARGSTPKMQDQVLLNGAWFSIVDVQVTAPGGIPLFYILVLRM